MNTLIKITENTSKLFTQFKKKVPMWDYANISKENYLSTSYEDKEKIIKQYYLDMKFRSGGEFEFICCLFCL